MFSCLSCPCYAYIGHVGVAESAAPASVEDLLGGVWPGGLWSAGGVVRHTGLQGQLGGRGEGREEDMLDVTLNIVQLFC